MIFPMSSTVSTVASICQSTTPAKRFLAVWVSVSLSPWLLSMLIRETLASSVPLMLKQYSPSNCPAAKSRGEGWVADGKGEFCHLLYPRYPIHPFCPIYIDRLQLACYTALKHRATKNDEMIYLVGSPNNVERLKGGCYVDLNA